MLWANPQVRPLLGSAKWLVGWAVRWLVAFFWWVLSLGCCAPRLSQSPLHLDHLSVLVKRERGGPPGQHPTQLGKLTDNLSVSPMGESLARGFLLPLSCAALWGGVIWVKQNCSYPVQCVYVFSKGAVTLLDSWTSTKVLFFVGDCQNRCFMRDDGRKLLGTILLMSLSFRMTHSKG